MAVFACNGTNKLSETGKCDLHAKCVAGLLSAGSIGAILHQAALLFLINGSPLCCESLSGQKRSGHMDTTHNVC